MKAANPYLNFQGNTEEAFEFYRSVFGGAFLAVMRYKDFPDLAMEVPEAERGLIAHIALGIGDSMIMGTDSLESMGQTLTVGNNLFITLEPESREEAEAVFAALAEGGVVGMPLQATEWAELHGNLTDRFGVQWMVDYSGPGHSYP
jgi:PhnB protein